MLINPSTPRLSLIHNVILCFMLMWSCLGLHAQNSSSFFANDRLEIEAKYGIGVGEFQSVLVANKHTSHSVGLQFSYLLSFSEKFHGGLGLGLTKYDQPSFNTLPVDLKFVYRPFNKLKSIEIGVSAGYAFAIESNFERGYRYDLELTWRPKIRDRHRIGLSFGLMHQQFKEIFEAGFSRGIHNTENDLNAKMYFAAISYLL